MFCNLFPFVIFIILILGFEIYADKLARIVAPGFSEEQFILLTRLLRIILPAQFFFYVVNSIHHLLLIQATVFFGYVL